MLLSEDVSFSDEGVAGWNERFLWIDRALENDQCQPNGNRHQSHDAEDPPRKAGVFGHRGSLR